MLQTIEITVKGKVQGVFYRQSTREKALELGINGEVKNLANGDVHILASGTAAQLQSLIEWCRTGPARAVVSELHTKPYPFHPFNGFIIRR
jgi:acylphosphatase